MHVDLEPKGWTRSHLKLFDDHVTSTPSANSAVVTKRHIASSAVDFSTTPTASVVDYTGLVYRFILNIVKHIADTILHIPWDLQ